MSPFLKPRFEHKYYYTAPKANSQHSYKGSLIRHITIENWLYRIRSYCIDHDAISLFNWINKLIDIPFGLNCNFPMGDVVKYFVWRVTKGYYDYVPPTGKKP